MNIGILPSVNFTKEKRALKPEISVCSRIMSLIDNQTKSPKKAYYSFQKEEKAAARVRWYCENCTTIGLRLARLGCVGFSMRKTAQEKPDAKSLGTYSKNTIHPDYATSSKYPGKEGPSLGKYKSNILFSEVPTR